MSAWFLVRNANGAVRRIDTHHVVDTDLETTIAGPFADADEADAFARGYAFGYYDGRRRAPGWCVQWLPSLPNRCPNRCWQQFECVVGRCPS